MAKTNPDPRKKHSRLERRQRYAEYLRSDHWRKVRAKALKHHGARCWACGTEDQLHVHHRTYARVGQERMSDLAVLCFACHEKAHELVDQHEARLVHAHEAVKALRAGQDIPRAHRTKRSKRAEKAANRLANGGAEPKKARTKHLKAVEQEYASPRRRKLEAKYERRRAERRAAREASM